jgi:hypothetical protein
MDKRFLLAASAMAAVGMATGRISRQEPEMQTLDDLVSPDGNINTVVNADFSSIEDRVAAYMDEFGFYDETMDSDIEAYREWFAISNRGGPEFILDSFPNPFDVFSRKPNDTPLQFFEDRSSFPTPEQKWVKFRGRGYSKAFTAQQHARKQKRLDKRAKTKANRKRARKSS